MPNKIAVLVSLQTTAGVRSSAPVLTSARVESPITTDTLRAFATSHEALSTQAAAALLPDFIEALESSTVYRMQLPKLPFSGPGAATLKLTLGKDHPLLTCQSLRVGIDGAWYPVELSEKQPEALVIELPLLAWTGTLGGELLMVGKLATRGLRWKTWLTKTLVDKKQVPPLLRHTLNQVTIQRGKVQQQRISADSAIWQQVGQGRILLFLHGTGMDGKASFDHMGAAAVEQLSTPYAAMISLDHPTVKDSTLDNAKWLVAHLPQGRALSIDILAVSRGGLVARQLVEQVHYGKVQLKIRRVVFVATPHMGTPASFKSRGSLTSKLRGLYTTGQNEPSVARGSHSILETDWSQLLKPMPLRPGQADQNPGSTTLRTLNTQYGAATQVDRHRPELAYYGITAEYQLPLDSAALKRPGMVKRARARAQTIFGHPNGVSPIINDLIVPCYSAMGLDPLTQQPLVNMDPALQGLIPIPPAQTKRYGPDQDLTHLSYLGRLAVQSKIRGWLTG